MRPCGALEARELGLACGGCMEKKWCWYEQSPDGDGRRSCLDDDDW